MRELYTPDELFAASGGDALAVWAGQGVRRGVRAWTAGDAVVVASPAISKHDRLSVLGPVADVAVLARDVLAEVGPSYRLFGDEALVRELALRVPELEFSATFGWMDTSQVPELTTTAAWLDGDAGVAELLQQASPDSYAWPGQTGVRRWAAISDDDGELLSVAADAWSAPDIGFLAGVATRSVARGKGLSRQVCAFVTAELVKSSGRAALMVNADNAAAIHVYERLAYTYRPVAAAALH